MAKELIREKEGKIIKYSIDSATRKYVGTCATLGLHFNSDKYPHLPTTNITSEITDNITNAVTFEFQILAAESGISAKQLYSTMLL